MVQIRKVPEALHRELKARAAYAGVSLSDFLLREIENWLARPSREELLARLESRSPVKLQEDVIDVLSSERSTR
jgi:antitoxin FitA